MLLLWKILGIILALQNVHCTTRDTLAVEMSYQNNIMLTELSLGCPIQKPLKIAWCRELFDRTHYRYEVKVFLNQQHFKMQTPNCTKRHLTFTAIQRNDTAHSQYMFTCFGRHEPVRTSPHEDDFVSAFLLAASPDLTVFYVFRLRLLGRRHEFTLYEEITDMAPNIQAREPSLADLDREEQLLTIRTDNLWIPDVQRIYLNEMVLSHRSIRNWLQGVKPQHLYFMCIYALRNAKFMDPAFVLDAQRFEAWDGQPLPMALYFDFENPKYSKFRTLAYPCYGRHQEGMLIENRKFLNLYRISSGSRMNSMFVYQHVVGEQAYRVLAIYENLDLLEIQMANPLAGAPAAQMTGQPVAGLQVTSQQMTNLQLANSAGGPSAPLWPAARLATPRVLAYPSATPNPRQFAGAPGSRYAQFLTPPEGSFYASGYSAPVSSYDPDPYLQPGSFFDSGPYLLPGPSYASGYSAPGSSYDPDPYLLSGPSYATSSYPPQPTNVEAGASSSHIPYQLAAPYALAGSSYDPAPYLLPGSSYDPGPYLQLGSSFDPGPYLQLGSSYDPGPYLQPEPSYATGSNPPQPTSVEAGASSSYIPYPSSPSMQPQLPSQSEESYRPQLPEKFSQEQTLPNNFGQSSEPPYEYRNPYYIGNPSLQQQEPFGGSYYPQSTSTADKFDPSQMSNQQGSEEGEKHYQEMIRRLAEQYRRQGPGND